MYQENHANDLYTPVFFGIGSTNNLADLERLLKDQPSLKVMDLFAAQKKELFKSRSPRQPLRPEDLDRLYREWLGDKPEREEGIWVYYPWNGNVIHVLGRDEFIEVRTVRNRHKITEREHQVLLRKKIGIVGLSVGHAVALTIASERICDSLKLADFDTLELGNLNRIRTGLHHLGLNKCVVTAREIAEIDPFLHVTCYRDGLTAQNIEHFLADGGNLDLLIDECDDLEMKIYSRWAARRHGIPVIMETSDRGMLDVERFDLTPERPVFHGALEGIPDAHLQHLAPQNKLPLVLKIVDAPNGSAGGKASMLEIGRSIPTWPQLSSSVTLGGAVVTDVSRRILLDKFRDSGRYYVDLEELVRDKASPSSAAEPRAFNADSAQALIDSLDLPEPSGRQEESFITSLVEAAGQAPSYGNFQPWKWIWKGGRLYLFHDPSRDYLSAAANRIETGLSFGAATENVLRFSASKGIRAEYLLYPAGPDQDLVAAFSFRPAPPGESGPEAAEALLYRRTTQRGPVLPDPLSQAQLDTLDRIAKAYTPDISLHLVTSEEEKSRLSQLLCEFERIYLLNPTGHADFFSRFLAQGDGPGPEAARKGLMSMGYAPQHLAALSLLADPATARILREINGGEILTQQLASDTAASPVLGFMTIRGYSPGLIFRAGILMQRLWLEATALELSLAPIASPVHLLCELKAGSGCLSSREVKILQKLNVDLQNIIPDLQQNTEVAFIFRASKAHGNPPAKPGRIPVAEVSLLTAN